MADKDEIRLFVVGDIQTNCYAYVSAGECLVVDPGASGARIAEALSDVKVTQVVATHRHHDHVGGVRALVEATGAPWAISADDAELAVRAMEVSSHDLSVVMGGLSNPPEPDRLLSEGDVIEVGTASFEVLAAPGHTAGGIVLLGHGSAEGVAFVGDTIFAGGCGRCDLMGGDWGKMKKTLVRLSRLIDPAVTLLCGHGPATTMGYEVATNPYMRPDAERESWSD
jgi:hydroxyacylglutathione hydrolase